MITFKQYLAEEREFWSSYPQMVTSREGVGRMKRDLIEKFKLPQNSVSVQQYLPQVYKFHQNWKIKLNKKQMENADLIRSLAEKLLKKNYEKYFQKIESSSYVVPELGRVVVKLELRGRGEGFAAKESVDEDSLSEMRAKIRDLKQTIASSLKVNYNKVDANRMLSYPNPGARYVLKVETPESFMDNKDFFLAMVKKLLVRELEKRFDDHKLGEIGNLDWPQTPAAVINFYVPDNDNQMPLNTP